MRRSPTPGGHGSIVWVAMLASAALPLSSAIVSLRWRYCAFSPKQPPSAPARSRAAATEISLVIESPRGLGRNDVAVRAMHLAAAVDVVEGALLHLGLAEQEEVDVVARQAPVERRRELLPRRGRLDEMRRDDDDEIGLVLLIARAREQRAEHRHRAEPGNLAAVAQVVRLQEARDREALPIAQLDGRDRVALDQRRDRGARDRYRIGEIELAHLRRDLEVDEALAEHRRGERQAHAERLELDGRRDDPIRRGGGERYREFAAGEELGGVAGQRHKVRLGGPAGE